MDETSLLRRETGIRKRETGGRDRQTLETKQGNQQHRQLPLPVLRSMAHRKGLSQVSPHLEELMLTGQVQSAEIVHNQSGRPYLVTLYGAGHRIVAEAYGDRPNDALRNALGRLLSKTFPLPMPPGF